jgi:hypothetical protein
MASERGRHLDHVEAGRDRAKGGGMTTYSLTLRRGHVDTLRAHLLRPDGAEHVAYVFCTIADILIDPWDRQAHRKLLGYKVVPVPDDQVVESTPNLVTWQTTSFVSVRRDRP